MSSIRGLDPSNRLGTAQGQVSAGKGVDPPIPEDAIDRRKTVRGISRTLIIIWAAGSKEI